MSSAAGLLVALIAQAGESGDAALHDHHELPENPQDEEYESYRRQEHHGPADGRARGVLLEALVAAVDAAQYGHDENEGHRVQRCVEPQPVCQGRGTHIDFTIQPVEVLAESTASLLYYNIFKIKSIYTRLRVEKYRTLVI